MKAKQKSLLLIAIWIVAVVGLLLMGYNLLVALLAPVQGPGFAAVPVNSPQPAQAATPAQPQPGEKITLLRLYFATPDGMALDAETRNIPAQASIPDLVRLIVKALAEGPRSPELSPTIPKETTLNAVYYIPESRQVTLDFGPEIKTKHPGGSTGEMFSVMSITNSICLNTKQVVSVRFLLQGEEVETLVGHFDLTRPVTPDEEIIRSH